MAPIIELSDKEYMRVKKLGIRHKLIEENKPLSTGTENKEGFIYVSSMNLYVAKERSHLRKNWYEANKALLEEDSRMLTIPEFVNFLNYLRKNPSHENTQIYKDITQLTNPWRVEWLDAYFEKRKDGFYVLTGNKATAEKLETALMENRTPGISLDWWLKNPTLQGLPRSEDVVKGNLNYCYPRNGTVAGFVAYSSGIDLECDLDPSVIDTGPIFGVRAAKQLITPTT